MTREEQIKKEALRCFHEDIKCYDAFLYGTEFADRNPDLSSLWHDADEEPEGVNWKILCQDKHGFCWTENRIDIQLLYKVWYAYTEIESVVRWAYIKDLLPKGGEK